MRSGGGSPPHAWGRPGGGLAAGELYGSPPHAWGRPRCVDSGGRYRDGSPPHAWGRLGSQLGHRAAGAVHPHTRGEDVCCITPPSAIACGSPPHAWGRRMSGQRRMHRTEHGSPPHAWGNCCTSVRRMTASGSLGPPPHAWGRLLTLRRLSALEAVHPHTRGDDWTRLPQADTVLGSPPHAWGRPIRQSCRIRGHGPPPHAWGRLQLPYGRPVPASPVHPHTRGDDTSFGHARQLPVGTPPHAWGDTQIERVDGARRRFTPTRVGTTRTGPRLDGRR